MRINVVAVSLIGLVAVVGARSALRAQPTQSVWDGVYTEAQAARGDEVFQQECSMCHGQGLMGGEMAPGLAEGAFRSNWNGLTLGDMFDRIRVSMPPDDPGRLSRKQVADVLARLLAANQFPAGTNELYDRSEMLQMIKFEAARP